MLNAALVSPFAMLLNPESVIQAMEHSERLAHLHSRVYRPLDKPLIPKGLAVDLAEFDHLVDEAVEVLESLEASDEDRAEGDSVLIC